MGCVIAVFFYDVDNRKKENVKQTTQKWVIPSNTHDMDLKNILLLNNFNKIKSKNQMKIFKSNKKRMKTRKRKNKTQILWLLLRTTASPSHPCQGDFVIFIGGG